MHYGCSGKEDKDFCSQITLVFVVWWRIENNHVNIFKRYLEWDEVWLIYVIVIKVNETDYSQQIFFNRVPF